MSPRIAAAAVVLLMISCVARLPKPWNEVLPARIEGTWERSDVSDLPVDQAPPELRSLGVVRAARTVYRGPSEAVVSVYQMARGTSFEAAQKWRVETGRSTYLYRGDYFIVVETQSGKQALDRFTAALDAALANALR